MILRSTFVGIISELLLWGIIGLLIFILARGILTARAPSDKPYGQRITLYFKDASQLSAGAPVDFMGTDIGYVTQVKPLKETVEVQLETYPDAIAIPSGAVFTIEFNGLAGAKSLEILPPDGGPIEGTWQGDYLVQEPIRLEDISHTQMTLAEALEYSSRNVAHALGQVTDPKALILKIESYRQQIEGTQVLLVRFNKDLQAQWQRIHLIIQNTSNSILSFNKSLASVERITGSPTFQARTTNRIQRLAQNTQDIEQWLTGTAPACRLANWRDKSVLLACRTEAWQQQWQTTLPKFTRALVHMSTGLSRFDRMLASVERHLMATPLKDRLLRFRERLRQWSQQLKKWGG